MDIPPQPLQKDWQTQILEFCARRSKLIISLFWIPYILISIFLAFGSWQIMTRGPFWILFVRLAKNFGQAALLLLGLVVLPGILGRFRLEIKVTRVITLFRRQLGILVFLLAFCHSILIRFLPTMKIFPLLPFEIMGLVALLLLFVLFLTSNNLSMKYLGRFWKKLHRIIYVILWLVVLHVGLQGSRKWALIIFGVALIEVASLIYDLWKKRGLTATAPGA